MLLKMYKVSFWSFVTIHRFLVKFCHVFLKIISKYWCWWFLLGLDFIILMFYFQTFTKFILEFYRFSTAFPKCNVKFLKNFSNLSRIYFQNFLIFLLYFLESLLNFDTSKWVQILLRINPKVLEFFLNAPQKTF